MHISDHPSVPTAPSPFGQCTFSASLGGLILTENAYQPHSQLAMHRHDDPYLCIVLGGEYDETTPVRQLTVRSGAVISHAAHSEHANRFSAAGARCLNVTPTGPWRDNEHWLELESGNGAHAAPRDAFLRLQAELAQGAQASTLGVAAALFDLLHRSRERAMPGAPPAWLRRVRDRLESAAASPGLDELARDAGVHPAHLARAFRRWQGMSIGEYQRQRRLEQALHALARTGTPLAELALAAGYADHAHMARAVRQATGLTPRQYRTAMQSGFKNACPGQDCGGGNG